MKNLIFDNFVFRFFNKIADLLILNIIFVLCCLPIITIGPAIIAMFYVSLRMVRHEESYIVRDFFHSFRQNLKQGILIHLIFSLATLLFAFDIYVMWNLMNFDWLYKCLFIIFIILLLLLFMTYIYLYPTLAQFDNTIKNSIKNALLLSLRHINYTIPLVLITVFPLFCAWCVKHFIEWGLLFFGIFGFALITYINSHLFVRIFDNYIEKDDNAR